MSTEINKNPDRRLNRLFNIFGLFITYLLLNRDLKNQEIKDLKQTLDDKVVERKSILPRYHQLLTQIDQGNITQEEKTEFGELQTRQSQLFDDITDIQSILRESYNLTYGPVWNANNAGKNSVTGLDWPVE